VGTTFATNSLQLKTVDEDSNAGAHAVYGRTSFRLPVEYVAAETVLLTVVCGAETTVAGASMNVDAEVVENNATTATPGADLVTTGAQTCNSLIAAAKQFTVNAAGLAPGDKLEIRLSITTNDAATGTAIYGVINSAYIEADCRG